MLYEGKCFTKKDFITYFCVVVLPYVKNGIKQKQLKNDYEEKSVTKKRLY